MNRQSIRQRATLEALRCLAAENGWKVKDTIIETNGVRYIYEIR